MSGMTSAVAVGPAPPDREAYAMTLKFTRSSALPRRDSGIETGHAVADDAERRDAGWVCRGPMRHRRSWAWP